jgi:hypothetical protein
MKLNQAPNSPDTMSRQLGHEGKSGETVRSPAVSARKSPWGLASSPKRASGHNDEKAIANVERELGSTPLEGGAPHSAGDSIARTTGSQVDDDGFTVPKSPAKMVARELPSDTVSSQNRYSPLTPMDLDEDEGTI